MTELKGKYLIRLGEAVVLHTNIRVEKYPPEELGKYIQRIYNYLQEEQERDMRDSFNGKGE